MSGQSGPKRLRVSLAVDSRSKGTYANLLGRLAVGLTETGRVDTALVYYRDDPRPEWLPPEVRTIGLATQRASRSLGALVRYLRAEQPDVLVTHIVHLNLLCLGAAGIARLGRMWSGKLVVGHDHPAELSHASDRRDNKWAVKACYRFADGVVADSPAVREDAIRWCRLVPASVAVVPIPIDPFAGLSPDAPHPWLEPGQPPVFLSTGRLVPYKRVDLMIEAFDLLRRRHDARLLIIGQGPESMRLSTQIQRLGLADKAQLVGWVSDPRQWAARATALVLTSDEEGFGQVLTEAMSVGCPVVVTDALGGGPRYVTENGRTGLLVPRGDRAAVSEAMTKMLDPRIRGRYARLGAERVEVFSPYSCATTLVDFLETL